LFTAVFWLSRKAVINFNKPAINSKKSALGSNEGRPIVSDCTVRDDGAEPRGSET